MLKHFILRALCAAAVDVRGAGFLLEGGGVLADVEPPYCLGGGGVGVSRVTLGRRAGAGGGEGGRFRKNSWRGVVPTVV